MRPDGRLLAAADEDGSVSFFDPRTRQLVGRPYQASPGPHRSPPRPSATDLAAGPGAGWVARQGTRLLISSTFERSTEIRDATTLRPVRRFPAGGVPLALSPDERTFAFTADWRHVRLLDLRSGRVRAAAGGHDAPVTDLRFSPTRARS